MDPYVAPVLDSAPKRMSELRCLGEIDASIVLPRLAWGVVDNRNRIVGIADYNRRAVDRRARTLICRNELDIPLIRERCSGGVLAAILDRYLDIQRIAVDDFFLE